MSSGMKIQTLLLENNLLEKPFTYIYYPDMGHSPRGSVQMLRWRSDISEWLLEVDP
ncbi:MAG: hypothetical protein FWG77_07425 [Treponema sp.]|nr:hypothetical protein [Treponema sp.]